MKNIYNDWRTLIDDIGDPHKVIMGGREYFVHDAQLAWISYLNNSYGIYLTLELDNDIILVEMEVKI